MESRGSRAKGQKCSQDQSQHPSPTPCLCSLASFVFSLQHSACPSHIFQAAVQVSEGAHPYLEPCFLPSWEMKLWLEAMSLISPPDFLSVNPWNWPAFQDRIPNISGGFPGGTVVKNPPAMQELLEMQVRSLGWEDLWNRKWQPTPVFLPRKSHGQRSQAVYSPWDHKESATG